MPHTHIVFVKVKMSLFEDDRFLFDLNDWQKGLYVLLLGLAGKTSNKIRNEKDFIQTRLALKDLSMKDIEHISKVFKKFKLVEGYWIFEDFDDHHNYFYPTKGITEVSPKSSQNKNKNKRRIRKEKNIGAFAPPTLEETISYFETELKSTKERAVRYYQFYGSKNWFVGKNRMANWHLAAARSLEWADPSGVKVDDDLERVRAGVKSLNKK